MDYIKVILGFYTNWLLGFWGEQLIVLLPHLLEFGTNWKVDTRRLELKVSPFLLIKLIGEKIASDLGQRVLPTNWPLT